MHIIPEIELKKRIILTTFGTMGSTKHHCAEQIAGVSINW
jgi:hypothetical protein